ncbi:MAG: putative toxin-antitoxin system toxin component, PIN family [Nitrospinota bacterium]|nr:MAG: putative toxin-antitoxin system toxin component, PIN family [Nitrospinota bacterium]
MIRFVPDTNVLASATIVKGSIPHQIIQAWLRGEAELATSPVLLQELYSVLSRPRIQKYQWMTPEEVAELFRLLTRLAILASGERRVQVIAADPADDFVLSAAVETQAHYIVSGDHHLLEVKAYQGGRIVTPGEFIEILKHRRQEG